MRHIILSLLLLCTNSVYGQNNLNYIGTIILDNNTPISFKLELIEKSGLVSGISITNIGTKDETKSEIAGLYFKSDKSFQLQETQILYTNSEAPLNTFCYLKMNLSFKGTFKNKRLEGKFKGNFLDNTKCASGKIILIEEKKAKKKIKKIEKKIKKIYAKKNSETEIIKQTKILKDGDDFSIKWKGKKIILIIWDTNKED